MEGDHIDALVEQRHGRVALGGRIEPGVEPDHLDLRRRIHRPHAQREGIDALQHFGDREAGHITCDMAGGHTPGGHTGQVATLVVAGVGHGHIGRGLVAGDGLEVHVRKVPCHLERRLHVAEAGREDEFVALLRQVTDHAFGVGAFGYVFDVRGLHRRRLAGEVQRGFDRLATLVMLVHPAGVRQGRDVNEADLERLGVLAKRRD